MRYTSLSDLEINLEEVAFQPMPDGDEPPPAERSAHEVAPGGVLTIAEAKRQLAVAFGVKPEAVEITIPG